MEKPTTGIPENQDEKRDASGCRKAEGGVDLLYLYSNNSTESDLVKCQEANSDPLQIAQLLQPYCKKQAHILADNVTRLIRYAGLDRVGFLTLTFKDNVTDPKEAYNRFRSLNSHFLSQSSEFGMWLCVKERQSRGAIHFHLLIEVKQDIRTGVDFQAIKEKDYRSASPYLKARWKKLREACEKYNFGRSELLPIQKNAEAMSYYVGKYISKDFQNRNDQDKGMRKITYSRDWPKSSVKLAWKNDNSKFWRYRLKNFATYLGCTDLYQLTEKLGPGWAYKFSEEIILGIYDEDAISGSCLPDHSPAVKIDMVCQANRRRREKRLNLVSRLTKYQKAIQEGKEYVELCKLLYLEENHAIEKEKRRCKKLPEAPF